MQIRILFFNRWVGIHIGGTETHIKDLAYALAKRGHAVDILTTQGKELLKYETVVNVWYVTKNFGERPFSRSLSEDKWLLVYASMFGVKSLLKFFTLLLKGRKYDIVSVHCTLEAFLMRAFIRCLFKIPYVFVFEGYTDAEAREAKHADFQIAISQDIADKCFANYGYRPVVIPVGTNLQRFDVDGAAIRKKYGGNGEKLVLTVCRLDSRKDIPTLVSAADIVCKKSPPIKFLIVGDGQQREAIELQIRNLGLSEKVLVIREMPVRPEYYKACDLFVLPSLYEGFGIVFLEAMSAGLPVIATTAPAIPEVVGDCGMLVPVRRPDLLAEKILLVMGDDKLRKKLIVRGLNRAKRYDWNSLIASYEKVYEMLIRPRLVS